MIILTRGGTTISAGAIQLGDGGTSGSIIGNVTNNGTLIFNRSDTVTFDGVISGTGNVAQLGTGTTVLLGDNTYSGSTEINAGVLSISQDANLGTPPSSFDPDHLLFNGVTGGRRTLQATASFTLHPNRGVTLNSDGSTFDVTGSNELDIGGVITGGFGLYKSGTGTLILSGDNTYLGHTQIDAGVLSISQDANLGTPPSSPEPAHLLFNGGTLQATESFPLHPFRGVTLNADGGTFDVTGSNVLSYGGVITGVLV